VEALIVLSVAGVAGWWWLLRESARTGGLRAPVGTWLMGDALLGGTFAALFVVPVVASYDKPVEITPEAIHGAIVIYVIIISLICGVVLLRGQSLQQAFGLAPARPFHVIGVGVLCIAATYPLVGLASSIAEKIWHSPSESDGMVQFFHSKHDGGDLLLAILSAVVLAPLAEEILFRGYIYGYLKKNGGRILATLVTAAIFAVSHANPPAWPALFLLALGLTLAYEITGSLWASIVMHMLFNSASVVVILWFPQWIH
jgi:membrane protease YdiL (CAAX protease family)